MTKKIVFEWDNDEGVFNTTDKEYMIKLPCKMDNKEIKNLFYLVPDNASLMYIDRPINSLNNQPVNYYEVVLKVKV